MKKKTNAPQIIFQFILRSQQVASQEARSDTGYVMVVISILTLMMFSILGACLTMTNLSKSSTNAYIDGTNTFYVAESGLNRRAEQLRQKFVDYAAPDGLSPGQANKSSIVTPANISNCFSLASTPVTSNDFECRNYSFRYNNNLATVQSNDGSIVLGDRDNNRNSVNYVAYTFVADRTNYATSSSPPVPVPAIIPAGELYTGLTAQEYKYTVYSTAAKPNLANPTQPVQTSEAKTVLQMDFKSRVIPLFQFAAFYEDDLEMSSQMPMTVGGPIHTNGNLRAIAYGFNNQTPTPGFGHTSLTPFTSSDVIAGTRLLGKVTAAGSIYDRVPSDTWRPLGCASDETAATQTTNCGVMSVYTGSAADPSTDTDPTHYAYFPDFASTTRTTPLTTSELAGFGGKMLDGSNGGVRRLNPPKPGFLREKNYVTNEVGVYFAKADMRLKFFPDRAMPFDFTSIKAGSGCDLTATKIPIDRQGSSALTCTTLTKGQLWSLQQPVLITTTTPTGTYDLDILKALKVAIASAPNTVTLFDLSQPIVSTSGWGLTFKNLLNSISGLTPATTTLLSQTPNAIVAARGSSFLPPPIQLVTGTGTAANNNVNGGFYNQLKGSWMTMLQTNIKSLTHWNRDGIYVEATDADLTTPYTAPTTLALTSGLSTNNLAFLKAPVAAGAVADSFPAQGLAAADRTEGGLVFHATVSDDTNGDGTNEITASNTNPIPGKDEKGNPIAQVDNYRIYPGITGIRKSPYGFVFSGGEELPGALTIATDGAAYLQGDYNNPGVAPGTLAQGVPYRPSNISSNDQGFRRQPAAIIADTITVLSNQCLNTNQQVNCATSNSIGGTQVSKGIAINAAFLSNLMKSGGTPSTFNGGLNKFMRLLENWGGSTSGTFYNYTGSMVSLGEPLESDELPSGSGVPQRNFNYDPNFNAFGKLPPLTPSAIYLQQEVFKRIYN